MDIIREFLKQEEDIEEARAYKQKEREYSEISSIMKEIEIEEIKKRENFKKQLQKLGIKIIDKKE